MKFISLRDAILFIPYLLTILFIIGGGFILYQLFHESPPVLFPTDDPLAIYQVEKRGKNYWLIYQPVTEVLVGKSKVRLDDFIGRPIRVTGGFAFSNRQCIQSECHPIFSNPRNKVTVFDIDMLK